MKPTADKPGPALPRSHIVLAMLMLVCAVNFLDRQILSILLPQIRAEFHLSDTQLGLLAGPAFVLVYIVLGIPAGLYADRGKRRIIIAASLAFFSLMTFLCGLAGSFLQLLGARFGTGVGEAGTAPAINALISDLYPPHQRAGALSVYSAGSNIGLLVALFAGSWVAQMAGWRMAFLVAAIPGLLIAGLFLLVVHEPTPVPSSHPPQLMETVRMFWSRRTARFTAAGGALASISSYGALAFLPSFLIRSHHMSLTSIGLVLALLTGIVGFAGTALPGLLADRFGRGDERAGLYVSAAGILCSLPFTALFYLAGNLAVAIAALVIPVFFSAVFVGPGLAAVQNIAPPGMRAQGAALLMLITTLVGAGLGPQMIGLISDLLRPLSGEDALRYALLSTVIPSAIAAWCFWRAAAALHTEMPVYKGLGNRQMPI